MSPVIANTDACCDLYGSDGGQTIIGARFPPAKRHIFFKYSDLGDTELIFPVK